ncbi:MAG: hypothetical protein IKQ20_03800 [Bacteroidales bacterium]|nr:hypothetical protein [Bacteroidales bacterium]
MIVDKNQTTTPVATTEEESSESVAQSLREQLGFATTVEEAYTVNALSEAYLAVRQILSEIHVDPNDESSPLLFKTIKLDNGQLARIKGSKRNEEYALGFPAVLIHFINVYYNVGQQRIGEGKGTMRIHYILNTLNNSDDGVELQGFEVFNLINAAINAKKSQFPALVNRFQLAYWDQPLSFDDGLQPYWIDYQIWFNDYTAYRYKGYVDRYLVAPPFTNHSDQNEDIRPDGHGDHDKPTFDEVSNFGSDGQ